MLKFNLVQEEVIAIKIDNRVNEGIRASELRVISSDGAQLGIMSKMDAVSLARSQGLDLVEIASDATPPVAKIIDFGKFRYEKEKSFKENKKKQKVVVVKEIKIRPQIDFNDLQIKKRRVEEFLNEGNKVKVILVIKGRQKLYADKGIALLESFIEDFTEIASSEKNITGGVSFILTPKKSR